ncbi:putative nuclease HARBI1 [Myzus persicae]|uniref:putative nuclease HARBI1 n=1 Tax=Myzus persicae TaxID=13164 RepID=UPI000B931EC9|nr:putative nuclease HARBI1 [Myzus persicae]
MHERFPKRYVRDMQNPIDSYSDKEFKNRFRFVNIFFIECLMPLIFNEIEAVTTMRGLPVPQLIKLLAVLRFYGTGNIQLVSGDLVRISQPSISFVGVDGTVDCTHIPIQSPGGDQAENFRNKKGIFSINVQIVSGPKCEILDIVARWPGSVHDSRIFSNSNVNMMYEQKQLPGCLLSDGGYPQLQYLFTPIRNPQTIAEERYNKAHIATRNTVERLNDILKRSSS